MILCILCACQVISLAVVQKKRKKKKKNLSIRHVISEWTSTYCSQVTRLITEISLFPFMLLWEACTVASWLVRSTPSCAVRRGSNPARQDIPTDASLYPGPGCSKSDQDNPALASSCKFLAGEVSCSYCLPFSYVPKWNSNSKLKVVKKWKIDARIRESANVSQFFSKQVRSWPVIAAHK